MSMNQEEPTLHDLPSRMAEGEHVDTPMAEELASLRQAPPAAQESGSSPTAPLTASAAPGQPPASQPSRRRGFFRRALLATAALVGAGALLEAGSGTALASGPGTFTSSNPAVPAVKATGTKGAKGVVASSDTSTGVSATSTSGNGLFAQSTSGLGAHVVGGGATASTPSFTEAGIFAEGGPSYALYASSTAADAIYAANSNGNAMHAVNLSPSEHASGLFAEGGAGYGVYATATGIFAGVYAENKSTNGPGLQVTSSSGYGAYLSSTTGTTLYALNTSGGLAGQFVGNVQVTGTFSATGTKNFVQAHPTDPTKEIVYVALEAGEAGTYVRGSGQLDHGKAVIELPEHFGLVTASSGLTVHLTPRGAWLQLYAVELDTTQLVVREAQGQSGAFDYLIHGVRRGYEQHEVIRTKH